MQYAGKRLAGFNTKGCRSRQPEASACSPGTVNVLQHICKAGVAQRIQAASSGRGGDFRPHELVRKYTFPLRHLTLTVRLVRSVWGREAVSQFGSYVKFAGCGRPCEARSARGAPPMQTPRRMR